MSMICVGILNRWQMYHRKNAKMKKHTGLSSQGHVCHSMLFYLNSFISTYEWMRINVVLMKETCNSFRVNSQIVLEISGLDFLKRQNSSLISTLPRFDCTLQIRVKLWLFWTVLQVSFVPFFVLGSSSPFVISFFMSHTEIREPNFSNFEINISQNWWQRHLFSLNFVFFISSVGLESNWGHILGKLCKISSPIWVGFWS